MACPPKVPGFDFDYDDADKDASKEEQPNGIKPHPLTHDPNKLWDIIKVKYFSVVSCLNYLTSSNNTTCIYGESL